MAEDDPKTLTEFADWIRDWRIELSDPDMVSRTVGFDFYDSDKATNCLERFVSFLNKLAPPSIVADILKEFKTDSFRYVSEVNAVLARGEQLVRKEIPPEQPSQIPRQRKMYDRDHLWLQWYETKDSGAAHSPARIRDRWNRENPHDTIESGPRGIDSVKKGLKQAREERGKQGNADIPPSE